MNAFKGKQVVITSQFKGQQRHDLVKYLHSLGVIVTDYVVPGVNALVIGNNFDVEAKSEMAKTLQMAKTLHIPVFTLNEFTDFISAEINKPWDGVGLPPVGTHCELYNCGLCHVGVIAYLSDDYTIMKLDDGGEQHFHSKGLQFKRLKTEHDKTVDMICGVLSNSYTEVTDVVKDLSTYRHYAESLIKAGYRKQVSLNREFSTGDTYNPDVDSWTAGIHIPCHNNVIEVYAGTKEGAELLRDEILERLC